MTWSSRPVVRGRVEAGVQLVPSRGAAWTLEELELPPPEPGLVVVPARPAEDDAAAERERVEREAAARERLAAEAHARGLAEGRAAGEAAAEARFAEAAAALGSAVTQLREQEERYLHAVEENLAALAVAVARHVVGREVRQDPTVVTELVRRALTEFPVDQPVRVRVHPLDLTAITAATTADGAPLEIAPQRDLAWLADPRVQRGGVMLEGRERVVDGRVDVALERAYRRLTGVSA